MVTLGEAFAQAAPPGVSTPGYANKVPPGLRTDRAQPWKGFVDVARSLQCRAMFAGGLT
jgi:hypothetical protein